MKKIFDLRWWWKTLDHNQEQMDLFGHIEFKLIEGHTNLFVADVTEEEATMLQLLGVDIDHTIATDLANLGNKTRMLYFTNKKYTIIEINHDKLSKDK